MDRLFFTLSSDGEIFYGHFWLTFFNAIFSWYFPVFWGIAIFIGFIARRYHLRGPVVLTRRSRHFLKTFAMLWPFLVFLWFTFNQTGAVPHMEDELTILYQARTISTGTYPGVRVPDELRNTFQAGFLKIASGGRLLGIYPPGFPLVLSVFDLVGILKWASFLLLAANLWILSRILNAFFSSRRVFPWLLLCCSSFFLLHSVFLFSQSVSLFLVNVVWLRRIQEKPLIEDYLISSFLFLTRPLDGLLLFVTLFIWQIFLQQKSSPEETKNGGTAGRGIFGNRFPWESLGFLVFIPVCLLHQKIHTGDWFESTYHLVFPRVNLFYGPDIGMAIPFGFNLSQAFKNFALTLLSLNETLFGWPCASLLPLLFFYREARAKGWLNRPGMSFAVILSAVWFFGYFHFFFPGIVIGPRFHQPLIGVFLVQSCIFIFSKRFWRPVTLFLCLMGLINLFSYSLLNFAGVLSFPEKEFKLISDRIYVVPERPRLGKELFRSFFTFNDVFDLEKLRFIHERDYLANPGYFLLRYGNRLASFPNRVATQKTNDTTANK
ncbi:MAG: hypothetical protein WA705_28235 [Candidatus Ozemobacteraceae bacterium]